MIGHRPIVWLAIIATTEIYFGLAEAKPPPPGAQVPVRRIEIVPAVSQTQITVGSGLSIIADIQNKSDVPVFLHPKYFTMTPTTELTPCGMLDDWWSLIPSGPAHDGNSTANNVVRLAPGSRTTALWGLPRSQKNCNPSFLSELGRAITFAPGEYTIRIVGMYWLDQKEAGTPEGYQTETAEIRVKIGSPQHVILLGAAIGGLVAAFFSVQPARVGLRLITAPLLAATVTILLSRLSDAPLPIRVSINDFWGSIAVGFVAAMWGPMLLRKLVPGGSDGQRAVDEPALKPPRPAPTPATPPTPAGPPAP